jgi:tRNA(adenine34) deaminase
VSPVQTIADPTDVAMMRHCIELSRSARRVGEYPFGAVVALDGMVVAEAINHAIRDDDVSRHAEVIALSEARKTFGRKALRGATLYTNVEPCAMCSFCLREAQVGRVVYAICSPVMGGDSKWNILRDDDMTDRLPQIFGVLPEVVSGLLNQEAEQVWREWNPAAWHMIKRMGFMTGPGAPVIRVEQARTWSLWRYLRILFFGGAPSPSS